VLINFSAELDTTAPNPLPKKRATRSQKGSQDVEVEKQSQDVEVVNIKNLKRIAPTPTAREPSARQSKRLQKLPAASE
jgi:hypothetical protein